jgi:hypothetical protein
MFCSAFGAPTITPRLPSKQFQFGGNAITFNLKFARRGINESMARLIEEDYRKMKRVFKILDRDDQGGSIFSYLIIFNKLTQRQRDTPLADFL